MVTKPLVYHQQFKTFWEEKLKALNTRHLLDHTVIVIKLEQLYNCSFQGKLS